MKIFSISDLHFASVVNKPMDVFGGEWIGYEEIIERNWKSTVEEDDLVLIAGDLSWGMTLDEAKPDLDKIGSFPGIKVVIKGNHEYWWSSISKVRAILPKNMFAIQNDCVEFGDYLICGTRGWSVSEPGKKLTAENQKIQNREVERCKLSLQAMQAKRKDHHKVIFMIHYPPTNSKLEDSVFSSLFEEYKVDKVVFGHLHSKYVRTPKTFTKNNIDYFLTSCDQVNNMLVRIY